MDLDLGGLSLLIVHVILALMYNKNEITFLRGAGNESKLYERGTKNLIAVSPNIPFLLTQWKSFVKIKQTVKCV